MRFFEDTSEGLGTLDTATESTAVEDDQQVGINQPAGGGVD